MPSVQYTAQCDGFMPSTPVRLVDSVPMAGGVCATDSTYSVSVLRYLTSLTGPDLPCLA